MTSNKSPTPLHLLMQKCYFTISQEGRSTTLSQGGHNHRTCITEYAYNCSFYNQLLTTSFPLLLLFCSSSDYRHSPLPPLRHDLPPVLYSKLAQNKTILTPPIEYWDYKCMPPCLVCVVNFLLSLINKLNFIIVEVCIWAVR